MAENFTQVNVKVLHEDFTSVTERYIRETYLSERIIQSDIYNLIEHLEP